jgi:hypothetical protein
MRTLTVLLYLKLDVDAFQSLDTTEHENLISRVSNQFVLYVFKSPATEQVCPEVGLII